MPAPTHGGRPPLKRLPGSLKPVYELLARLMPKHAASSGQKALAFALASRLRNNPDLAVPNMLRELGTVGETANGIHPDYFAAFKQIYDLEALGIGDTVLLHPNEAEREAMIRALVEQHGFEWLWAQRTDEARLSFLSPDDLPEANRMGLDSERFETVVLPVANGVAVNTPVHLVVELPWAGYATLLSQDPTELRVVAPRVPGGVVSHRPTFSLDVFAGGLDQPLPAGRTILPRHLTMNPPFGLTRTLLVAAQTPFRFPWDRGHRRQLTPDQLADFMGTLLATDFRAAGLEYHVVAAA